MGEDFKKFNPGEQASRAPMKENPIEDVKRPDLPEDLRGAISANSLLEIAGRKEKPVNPLEDTIKK